MPDWLTVSDEVRAAVAAGRPVVALESTLIAHGLPWPVNLETARESEAAVRAGGAVPATIAVLHGVPTVGLSDAQLEELAKRPACEGEPSRSRRGGRAEAVRGNNCLRDDGARPRGRDSRLRDRRHRRRATAMRNPSTSPRT